MKVKVEGARGHKIQVGQYEPADIHSSIAIEVDVPKDREVEEFVIEISAKIQNLLDADLRNKAVGLGKKHKELAALAKSV